jgi:hypothetical protein
MTKSTWFIIINIVLIVAAGILCFKNLNNLKKSLYWLIFPNLISIWSKKLWDKDFENTFRFELFVVLAASLVGINYLIFKFVL